MEALFNLPDNPFLRELISGMGSPFNGELVIKRTISREGRNRIMINGSMATLQTLSKIGLMLISISGQHEHQLLLRPENHLYLLDDFGGLTDEREDLEASFGTYQSLKEGFNELERKIKESEEKQALRRFQMEEIEKADLKPGEERLLEEEKNRLRHAQQLMHIVSDSYQMLYEKEDGIGIVTINRPASLNALNGEVYTELYQLFQEIEGDPEVRVVILTGSGEKAFVAGSDIPEMQPQTSTEINSFVEKCRLASDRIYNLSKPVIAAINGYTLGGG